MKRLTICIVCFLLSTAALWAQRPVVTAVSPQKAGFNEVVSISGSNLPTGTNAHVQFGAAKGTIVEASSSLIKARVPAGASYEGVSVSNLTAGLTGKSVNPFQFSFGGSGFDVARIAADVPFQGNDGMFDLCSCDFNVDGRVDVVTTHEKNTYITLYQNISSLPSTLNFAVSRSSVTVNAYTRNIVCGDLDADGRPDLAMTGTGVFSNMVYVFRNISSKGGSLSFVPMDQQLAMPNDGAAMLAMQDMNADGRPDLVVTNKAANIVTIFKNASAGGSIIFDSQIQNITIEGPMTTFGIAIQDLDGDGLPDLAVTPVYDQKVYLLRNTSVNNGISFAAPVSLASSNGLAHLIASDLNGDAKADLAAVDLFNNKMLVWLNGSSSGSLQFSSATEFATDASPHGLATGDLDGDGLNELVVSHFGASSVKIFANTTSAGTFSLSGHSVVVGEKTRHAQVVDFTGDAKPDIAITGSGLLKSMRILRNMHCVKPRLSHSGTLTLCSGQTLNLQATQAPNVSYTWTRNGVALSSTESFITISEAGDYAVTVTSATDGCSFSSPTLTVIAGSGTGSTVAMEPIPPVCAGGTAQLKATAINGATYVWNGPNGFTATTTSASYSLTSVQASATGTYSVVIKSGDCQFTPAGQTLTVNANPQPQITASATAFCAGTTVTLQATAGFASYQWKLNGANYTGTGASTASITISTAGNYSVMVKSSAGCTGESAVTTISQTQAPVADFDAPSTACLEQPVSFTNTSTYASGSTPNYVWSFGDGQTSTEANPSHAYAATGTYTVSLTAKYGNECSHSTSKTISVVASPNVQILAAGSTTICPGESVELVLDGDVSSVLWSTGETTLSIFATESTTYKASIVTSAGCTLERTVLISHLEQPQISISASATTIRPGETVTLAAGGGLQYEWEQSEEILDIYSQTVSVAPTKTTTYAVKGWSASGCAARAEVTIVVDNTLIINPPKIFVPAVDGSWKIADMELYPEVELTIVNSLGRKIYSALPYSNNWDGTERSAPVEPGVYYYIFKDSAGKVQKTGSITLLR